MHTSQKKLSHVPYVDYIPAVLKISPSNGWMIVFYAKKPGKRKLIRVRRRVKKIDGYNLRMKYAKRICHAINIKLAANWSPFIDGESNSTYTYVDTVITTYLEHCTHKFNSGVLRKDTLRSYNSYAKVFREYLHTQGKQELLTVEFVKPIIVNFLDHIYFEKKRTAGTSNNYLTFLSQLSVFMMDRGFLNENPTLKIQPRRLSKKVREVIPTETLDKIFNYQRKNNFGYLVLMLSVYSCFIRRTEITKLKVSHVNLDGDTISIPKEIAKNKKDDIVTIPRRLRGDLQKHIENAADDDFLFSNNNYRPGKEQLKPKKVSDEWSRMRKVLGFKSTYQFYSLKDSGITAMFLMNIPTIKIRDQARHHDIRITEAYTPRLSKSDETIKNLDF